VDNQTNKLLGEFLQAEWKKHLGIDLKLEFVDSKTRSSRFNSSDFQLVTGGWQEDYRIPRTGSSALGDGRLDQQDQDQHQGARRHHREGQVQHE
jgi:oligopeptide transport system substrate-binding protein